MSKVEKRSNASQYRVTLQKTDVSLKQLNFMLSGCAAQTLTELAPVYLAEAKANRQKPSYVESQRIMLFARILPLLGHLQPENIGHSPIMALKAALAELTSKTVNNTLSVLRGLLKCAKAHGFLSSMPEIRQLKHTAPKVPFYSQEAFHKIIKTAEQ